MLFLNNIIGSYTFIKKLSNTQKNEGNYFFRRIIEKNI